MRRFLAVLVFLHAGLILTACHEPEPRYQASIVRFDERLAGTWQVDLEGKDESSVQVMIAPRTLNVKDGRVEPQTLGGPEAAPAEQAAPKVPNAFVGTLIVDAAKSKDGPREHFEIEVKGFMLNVDGESFVTFQPSVKQMDIAHLGGLVVPIQQALKYRCEGDTLMVWGPKAPFGWLPDVTWLDAPREDPGGEVDLGDLSEGPRRVTMDVERFVGVLRKYGKVETFWEEPAVLKRGK